MPATPLPSTRRRHHRLQLSVVVKIRLADGFKHFRSKNLSPGGMFILADTPLSEETRLELEVFLPRIERAIHARGEVAWIQRMEPTGFAIRFTDIEPGGIEAIRLAGRALEDAGGVDP